MDPQHLTIMANTFQSVLDASVLNERGLQLEFSKRERLITPFRFGLSVVASMATEQVVSIADLHRQFNDLWDLESSYKAFYNQLVKPNRPEFFRTSLCHIMGQLTMKVLGFEAGQAFSEFNRLVIQDGSSFALHDALAHLFPGRFNTVKPAAVELHCTLDLLHDAPITIALSPDTDSEHAYRPEPASLRGALFLADRGYLDLAYVRDIDRHGGFFIVRAKAGLNPRVLTAFREDGERLKSCQDRELKAIVSKFPKPQRSELEVEWLIDGEPFRLRLIVRWKSKPGRPALPTDVQALIRRMVLENPAWGQERIANELLLKLGLRVSPRTVRKYMPSHCVGRPGNRCPSQHWSTFIRNQAKGIVACDFCVVVTATFRLLYVFVIIGSLRRECLDFVIPLGERHLYGIVEEWVAHYNNGRPHMSLGPGIPSPSPLSVLVVHRHHRHQLPPDCRVAAEPILGGLHHEYQLEKRAA